MASLDILTYQDAVDWLRDTFDVEAGSKPARRARRAVMNAYDRFPDLHRWAYFERRGQIHTVASSTTGTVTYDDTGGTYERQLTLSGSTWPTADDVRVYKVIINQQQYDIEDKKSSTVVTLSATNNPGADIAAGTSYTLYKSRYNLPINFRKMVTPLMELSEGESLPYVSPKEFLEMQAGNYQPQDPSAYTIINSGEYYGSWLVDFAPPPSIAENYDFIYEAYPRQIRTEKYFESGTTVTCNGTTTVTGSGTTFTSKMVGAILRVPVSGTTEPGGIVGSLDDASGNTVERFDEQRTIVSVETTTSLTVDSAISSRSGVGYTISDPIDMEPKMMTRAFLSQCEAEYARISNRDDRTDWEAKAHRDLLNAMGADNRSREFSPGGNGGGHDSLASWALREAYGGTSISYVE